MTFLCHQRSARMAAAPTSSATDTQCPSRCTQCCPGSSTMQVRLSACHHHEGPRPKESRNNSGRPDVLLYIALPLLSMLYHLYVLALGRSDPNHQGDGCDAMPMSWLPWFAAEEQYARFAAANRRMVRSQSELSQRAERFFNTLQKVEAHNANPAKWVVHRLPWNASIRVLCYDHRMS